MVLVMVWQGGNAQNSDEWLRQKQTRLRYLMAQTAALKIYTGYLKKGYGVVQNGLAVIKDVKTGEFSFHKDYFGGLQVVKPAVSRYWKVGAITLSANRILELRRLSSNSLIRVRAANQLYYQQLVSAWNGLLSALARNISEVQLFTGPNTFSLQDASRLEHISRLYDQMQVHESFAVELYSSSKMVEDNIKLEISSAKLIRSLYGN